LTDKVENILTAWKDKQNSQVAELVDASVVERVSRMTDED